MRRHGRIVVCCLLAAQLAGCGSLSKPSAFAPVGGVSAAPAATAGAIAVGDTATGPHGAVSSANPIASRIGAEVLQAGGNAVDAAVAVSFALGLLEPNASGVGGCGYLLYVPAGGEPVFCDYRSQAPAAFDAAYYTALNDSGRKNSIYAAGVPGAVAGWLAVQERYGTLPLARLLQPTIALAEEGFCVLPFLAGLFVENYEKISSEPGISQLMLNGGLPYAEGEMMKNPAYAALLRKIAEKGPDGFYTGAVAEAVAAVSQKQGGWITAEDLAAYQPRFSKPLAGSYRGHTVLAAAPSSSGGIALLESLNLLEHFDLSPYSPESPAALHLMAEAFKIANLDRYTYVADPAFVDIPVERLISKDYADARVSLISPGAVLDGQTLLPDRQSTSTTHLSVVDAEGNAISVTNTLGNYFGCGVGVAEYGFLLDNQLYDFSVEEWAANSPAAQKRPRSSICPVVVLKDGSVEMVLGSPGGEAIVTTMVQVLCNMVDFGMPLKEAIDRPRIYQNCTGPLVLEGGFDPDVTQSLRAMGHQVETRGANDFFFGGVHAVVRNADQTLTGASDPRRDGKAAAY